MVRALFIALVLAVGLTATSHAEDAKKQDTQESKIYRLIAENEKAKIFSADFKPGDKLSSRAFPQHWIYMLTDGTLVFATAGHKAYEMTFKAGDVQTFPPQSRTIENDSDKEVRVLVIEFKQSAQSSGKKRSGKGKRRRGRR
jgi:hypothetical protein